jgi:hypothetical protein
MLLSSLYKTDLLSKGISTQTHYPYGSTLITSVQVNPFGLRFTSG